MYKKNHFIKRCLSIGIIFILCHSTIAGQRAATTLRGKVTDQLGGVIGEAAVTLINAKGAETTVTTDGEGSYLFKDVEPGSYVLRIIATGFAVFEDNAVEIAQGQSNTINAKLTATIAKQELAVTAQTPLNTEPDNNASAIVLRGTDLDSLPDDPDELAAALRMLAGPSAGPSGAQIYVDGFTGDIRLPNRSSIREVRINQNPFSAENDRLGFGRIEVVTRAGTPQFHGQLLFYFNDERLNARNPFSAQRTPFQARTYSGDISGPLVRNRASFIVMYDYRQRDDNAIVNATVLDPSFNIVPFSQAVLTPTQQNYFRTQVDYEINKNNSFSVQYVNIPTSRENVGVGDFSLPSRAYEVSDRQQLIRMSERAIIKNRIINQTLFQYVRYRTDLNSDNALPTVRVLDAFTGGGPQTGNASNTTQRWELIDHATWTQGAHTFRAGGRIRSVTISDISRSNFGGSYTFSGGLAPQLDRNNQVARDQNGEPVLTVISSIERFRRTMLFQSQGLSAPEIRALGGGATQFSLATGNPAAAINQVDFGGFVQDDWRVRPRLTISLGLRYEGQTNIDSKIDFAPRVAFAWSPEEKGSRTPKTVIRGGAGIFFDRFSENYTLQAERFNGLNRTEFITNDPTILDMFPNVPSARLLKRFAVPQTIREIADDLRSPYMIQSSLSVERQLPHATVVAVTYINTRALHVLRTRNINAPLPGSFDPNEPNLVDRPLGDAVNIFQYESAGVFKQHQLVVTATSRINPKISIVTNYAFNKADSDTDGAGTFPADSYDLSGEFGRSSLDIRHRFALSSSVALPWNVRISPLIFARTGAPFNITTGRDPNGDTLFTERPALATDITKPGVVITPFGAFDPNPAPGQKIIPRNFGDGPGFFGVNLALSRTFGFGQAPRRTARAQQGGNAVAANAARSVPAEERPYKLNLAVRFVNLFNHVNPGAPIGNLSSPLFGISNASATDGNFANATSNRRIIVTTTFSF
ncbi:MAG TPA: TonB-dependent receptor [Blastocatellia bacterium]|nr:TonB-dependent receptor [Blastocatellia bacterium]